VPQTGSKAARICAIAALASVSLELCQNSLEG
jgi:hypothetical protein